MSETLLAALDRFAECRIGVVGDLMVDRFVYGTVDRISPEAPVPVVAVREKRTQPGGAANTAVNIRSLGGAASLFGVVGQDEAGREMLELLGQRGIDAGGVHPIAGRPTTVKTRVVAQTQQVVRIDEEDRAHLSNESAAALSQQLAAAIVGLDLVVVSDYAKGIVTERLAQELVKLSRGNNIHLLVDPKPVNAHYFSGAKVIKPNLGEALQLTGRRAPTSDDGMFDLCRAVQEATGIHGVVITAGARGSFVLDGEVATHIPGTAQEVYDVAGAGDSVLAALALGLATGLCLTDSARLGNLAGGIAVGHLGIAAVTAAELRSAIEAGAAHAHA